MPQITVNPEQAHRPSTPPAARGRVVHAVRPWGEPSQTFIVDAIVALEQAGWEGWVAATGVHDLDWFDFPPHRLLTGATPPLGQRLRDAVLLRNEAVRRGTRLERQVARLAPALVHAHFGWSGADVRVLARRLALPLVVSFHGTDVSADPGRRRYWRDLRPLLRTLGRATVVSSFLEGRLRRLGYDGPVDIVPAGIHLDQIPYSGAPGADCAGRVLFVGRLIACKGVDTLLHAMQRIPEAQLTIIGDGPERAGLVALTRELGVEGRIRFAGTQHRDAVLAALSSSAVLVAPSREMPNGQAEGSPVITKEALAVGTPVVGTRVGGLPETVPPDVRDELVEPNDPDGLADAIRRALESPDEERARAGREWVAGEFDWRVLADRLATIYDQVVA